MTLQFSPIVDPSKVKIANLVQFEWKAPGNSRWYNRRLNNIAHGMILKREVSMGRFMVVFWRIPRGAEETENMKAR